LEQNTVSTACLSRYAVFAEEGEASAEEKTEFKVHQCKSTRKKPTPQG